MWIAEIIRIWATLIFLVEKKKKKSRHEIINLSSVEKKSGCPHMTADF